MRHAYNQELEELKAIYEGALQDINPKHDQSLRQLIQTMRKFIDINDTRWSYQKKLESLENKLKRENTVDCEDWCGQGDCNCEE